MVVLAEISEQSSSSSSSSTHNYDVFLSFRGADTRCNFTDHLLKALREASINTFFDDSEIQIGEFLKPELKQAIRSSRASIIVLSMKYASSTWCLDELAMIMKKRRTSDDHIVFPIFYHVNPSDVWKQRNSFGDAMADHKRRLDAESNAKKRNLLAKKMEKWEKALTEVAGMKGEEANGRRETELIERIVKDIISRLQLDKRSKIPHIIGMESSIKEITSIFKDKSGQRADILTIWGMAGIGKTYLANYVFHLHCHDFERSCFLEDIEGKCTKEYGLLNLQKQLLKDMRAGGYIGINNVNEGTFNIENSLSMNRTLLVLDGINKFEQLDVLLGTKGLYSGSKIIITSKNKLLIEKCGLFKAQVPPKHTEHWLQGLTDEKSLELLSWYAFGSSEPNEGDKNELTKVVEYCKGHPLALKVLGSSFRSEDATWEDILESLGKEVNPGIKDVLEVSFKALPSNKDKELFKHIACFFVGEDRKFTEEILKACGICKSSGIKVLIDRCLITLDSYDDIVMMHQLLQDMGKDIVRQESTKMPWNRSILWRHEECLDVLQNRKGTSIVQGLALDMTTFEKDTLKESNNAGIWWLFSLVSGMCSSSHKTKGDFDTLALSEMRNLRLLKLNYVPLGGSYNNFPQGLRWLCMHGFHLSYIPSDLQMENMVALDMSFSKVQQLWKKPKLLKSLKFLNLSSCHELVRVGHFSMLPLLERLTLARCTSLVEVCESIGDYSRSLEVLDLSECSKLKKLPTTIRNLKNLTQLFINGCSNLREFPVEMKDMESLKVLKADRINITSCGSSSSTMVPRISKSLVSWLPSSLVNLSLTYCNLYTESFPKDCSSFSSLKELYLGGNPIDFMPDCVRSLSRLEMLSVTYCHEIKSVLCAPIQLKTLDAVNCRSLEKITFNPLKSALPDVFSFYSFGLTEIQDKFKIQALSEINEEVLHSLGWINVEYLNHCRFLKSFTYFAWWTSKMIPSYPEPKLPQRGQLLYEHGIFSTYLRGQEVPKWFTHRSNEPSFTLQSSQNRMIKGLNVCIVRKISNVLEVGPFRIEIRNLTKGSSWAYEPIMHLIPQDEDFENGDEVVVWLSHWMFGKNEFEDGDEVGIHFSVSSSNGYDQYRLCYDGGEPNCGNVREYGISLVYDDDNDDGGGNHKKDPLSYYKSWKHIIGGDLSAFELSKDHYLLKMEICYIMEVVETKNKIKSFKLGPVSEWGLNDLRSESFRFRPFGRM